MATEKGEDPDPEDGPDDWLAVVNTIAAAAGTIIALLDLISRW
ncbi:hypothetical protein [Nocardia asteroides]|nr:hypothetical protein [Nocardia asteroides]